MGDRRHKKEARSQLLNSSPEHAPSSMSAGSGSTDPEQAPIQRTAIQDTPAQKVTHEAGRGMESFARRSKSAKRSGLPPCYSKAPAAALSRCGASVPAFALHQERDHCLDFRVNQPMPKQTGHFMSPCVPVAPHASHAIQAFWSKCHVTRPPQTFPSASISRQRLVFVGSVRYGRPQRTQLANGRGRFADGPLVMLISSY